MAHGVKVKEYVYMCYGERQKKSILIIKRVCVYGISYANEIGHCRRARRTLGNGNGGRSGGGGRTVCTVWHTRSRARVRARARANVQTERPSASEPGGGGNFRWRARRDPDDDRSYIPVDGVGPRTAVTAHRCATRARQRCRSRGPGVRAAGSARRTTSVFLFF